MYGLKPHTIKAIQDVFAKHKAIEKAILYGSRAKGNYRNGSDIDLTLVGETLTLSQQFSIETDLDDLLLPYKMDLSIFHKIENEDLIDHINRIGIVFYDSNEVISDLGVSNQYFNSERKKTLLGTVPVYWEVKAIGEIADVTKLSGFEYTKHITYNETGEIIALRALNVREGVLDLTNIKRIDKSTSDSLERSKLYKGDLLFTYVGANIGQFALVPENEKYHLAPNICRIRANEDFSSDFLYSYFRSNRFQDSLEGYYHGSSQPTMPMATIRQILVPVPPIEEQINIAKVLHSLTDKIELLNSQNKTLEALLKALFRQWLVEEVNEEWEEESLSSIADFLNGLACQKFPPKNEIDKLPVLKIKDLKSGISDSSDFASTDVNEKYFVKNGDVIFSWSASLVVKIWNGEDCILNQHLFKVTSERFPKWFYYLWSKYHLDMFIAIAKAHATTMGHIKRGDLDDAMVVIPPPSELAKMSKTFTPLIDKIIANNQQIKQVEKLRDTLLPKLMNGEVRMQL
jgi:type I restriction enzyme S subunit